MALAYQLMYRIGLTPWDQHEISEPLLLRVQVF